MKSFLLTTTLAFFGVQLAIASPSKTGLSFLTAAEAKGMKVGVMTWTGRVSANDEHETSLRGDAKQIWDQIIAINPNYAKENGIEDPSIRRDKSTIQDSARVNMTALSTDDGKIICADRDENTVPWPNCAEGLNYLKSIGNGLQRCNTDPHDVVRVSCSWNCGIYVVNTLDVEWTGYCKDVASSIYDIEKACGHSPMPGLHHLEVVGGEVRFSDHWAGVYQDKENC